jgi:hypothetical protein
MAHLVTAHVVEISVNVVPIVKLLPTTNHDGAVLDINVHNNANVLLTFSIRIGLGGRDRPCKYEWVTLTGGVRTCALEVIVKRGWLVAFPGTPAVAGFMRRHFCFGARLLVEPTEFVARHLRILLALPSGQHESRVGTARDPTIL